MNRLRRYVFPLLALATLAGNLPGLAHFVIRAAERRSHGLQHNGLPHADARRAAIRGLGANDQPVFLFTTTNGTLNAFNRSTHIAMLWENAPNPVAYGGFEGFASARTIVSASDGTKPDFTALGLHEALFWDEEYMPGHTLWHRREIPKSATMQDKDPQQKTCTPPNPVNPKREAAVLAPFFLIAALTLCLGGVAAFATSLTVFGACVFGCLLMPPGFGMAVTPVLAVVGALAGTIAVRVGHPSQLPCARIALAFSIAYFALCTYGALSHTFIPPAALGTVGGKARLFALTGGIPPDFFTAKHWATLQPFYPPGFSSILLGYGLHGEWLVQTAGVFFAALCLYTLTRGVLPAVALWIFAAFCANTTLMMSSLLYPETLMALLLAAGWRLCHTRDSTLGFFLIGACGWIKLEGCFFLPIAWIVMRFGRGVSARTVVQLAFGLLLPLAWIVFAKTRGGGVYDYASVAEPDFARAVEAAKTFFRLAFLEPWRYGFAYPAALVLPVFKRTRADLPVMRALAFMTLCAVTFVSVFAFSRAPDFKWHLTSLERLLWPPALVALYGLCHAAGKKLGTDDTPFPGSMRRT